MNQIFKILFFIGLLFSFENLIAQTQPSGILFQAVARDASGNAASTRTIYAIVEIREATSTGSTVYSESHQVTSNDEGIFNLIIGNGARLSGATKFDNLNWRSQIYFINLKVAIAPSLPTPGWDLTKEYVDMGTSQIWAVPYAFSAFKAVIADSATKFGGVLAGESGGTGINNTGKTITLGKNFEIQGLGNLKFNTTGLTSLTLPQKGLLVSTDGIDTLSNKYILSPTLLGKPITPTADSSSSDSTIANIKYVKSSISNQIGVLKSQINGVIDSSSGLRLKISDTSAMLSNRINRDTSFLLQKKDTITLSNRIDNLASSTTSGANLKVNISDTSVMLSNRIERDTISLSNRINSKVNTLNARIDSSLYVNGKVKIDSILTINDSLRVKGNVLVDSNLTIFGKLSINGGFDFQDSLTVTRGARIDSSLLLKGKLYLTDSLLANGNAKINNNLLVNQRTRLNDSLTVMGVTRLNDSLTVRGVTRLNDSLTVRGVSRLNDSLLVRNSVKIDSNLFVGGKLTVASGFDFKDSLTVTRGARIDSSLLLKGKLILGDSLIANGNAKISNNLLVTGNTNTGTLSSTRTDAGILAAGNTTITGTLSTTGVATIGDNLFVANNTKTGTLSVTGATTLTGAATLSSTLSVADATTLNNGLTVIGNTNTGTLSSTRTDAGILAAGNTTITGTLSTTGVATIGDNLVVANNTKTGTLSVTGATTLTGAATLSSTLSVADATTLNNGLTVIGNTNTGTLSSTRTDAGILAAGNTTITGTLSTTGVATIGDNLVVANNTKTGTLSVTGATTLTGAATLSSTLSVADATTLNNGLTVIGNTNTGTLSSTRTDAGILAAGNTTITGTLSTTGVATIGDNLVVSNNTKTGTLSVTGATTLTGAATLSSTLSVADATTLNNGLTVIGNTNTGTLSSTRTDAGILAAGNTTITGTLSTTGVATIGDNLVVSNNTKTGTLSVTGATTLTGAVKVDGNLLVKGLNVSDSILRFSDSIAKFSTTKLNATDTASLSTRIDALSSGSNKFTADLTVNYGGGSFGKYTNGQTIPAAGKTIDEVFRDILTKVIHPSYSSPTASLTMPASGLIPSGTAASGNIEIGTNLGTLTFNPSFNKLDGGDYTTITYKKNGGTLGSSTDNVSQLTTQINYQVTYAYGAGTSVKKNNLNEDDVTNQVQAGSVNSNTVTITPASYKYWGMTTNSSANITDADIIAMVGGNKEWATSKLKSSFTITGPGGSGPVKYAFYAVPNATAGSITSILAGGFESIAAFDKVTRNFTNAQGYVVSYDIYVQKNSGTDNVTLIIQ